MPQGPNLSLNLPVRQDSGNVAEYYKKLAEEDDFDDYASSYGGTEWDDGATTARPRQSARPSHVKLSLLHSFTFSFFLVVNGGAASGP